MHSEIVQVKTDIAKQVKKEADGIRADLNVVIERTDKNETSTTEFDHLVKVMRSSVKKLREDLDRENLSLKN